MWLAEPRARAADLGLDAGELQLAKRACDGGGCAIADVDGEGHYFLATPKAFGETRMEHGRERKPPMERAGGKFRPHPGPLPQEREERLARLSRAPPRACFLRGTFLVPHPAGGGHPCWDGREREGNKGDGRSAGPGNPSPGG